VEYDEDGDINDWDSESVCLFSDDGDGTTVEFRFKIHDNSISHDEPADVPTRRPPDGDIKLVAHDDRGAKEFIIELIKSRPPDG